MCSPVHTRLDTRLASLRVSSDPGVSAARVVCAGGGEEAAGARCPLSRAETAQSSAACPGHRSPATTTAASRSPAPSSDIIPHIRDTNVTGLVIWWDSINIPTVP